MSFHIVRNDITNMAVDAIVNTANPKPVIGSGVDSRIHKMAGPKLLEARKEIGDIQMGDAFLTSGFQLPSKYVIHTSGPVWQGGGYSETEVLHRCYAKSLHLALNHQCQSIAFPLISSGNYGFPKGVAIQTAISAISGFLMEEEMEIYLVVFDEESYSLSENMLDDIESYIDQHYVEDVTAQEGIDRRYDKRAFCRRIPETFSHRTCVLEELTEPSATIPVESGKRSLQDLLLEMDDSFSTCLFRLIDDRGLTDPQVYKKANIDRKLFSKIRTKEDYKPSKKTVLALAIALELSLDETIDLLGRAGYALSKSSKFDVIVEYHIVNKKYNLLAIDTVLYNLIQDTISA